MNYILRLICVIIAGLCAANANLDEAKATFSTSSTKFAALIYKGLANGAHDKSFVFSPFSIQTSGVMLYTGAAGPTAEDMANGLALHSNDRIEAANVFQAAIANHQKEQLEIANKIYIAKGKQIKPEYHQIVTEKFNSVEEMIDFTDKEKAKTTINNWVKDVTHDKIPEIVKSDTFNNSTLLMLLNAVYFKGTWVYQFPTTYKGNFTTLKKQVKQIEIMSALRNFKHGYLSELDADVLEMDYENSNISMMIVLPKSEDGLTALEENIANFNLLLISENLKAEQLIDVHIPKFKIEYSVDLREPFEAVGMGRIFSDDADFSNMTPLPVKVGKALHKTFIDVNESGTEAAAVTAIDVRPRTIFTRFSARHPFMFAIKSKTAILFLGRFLG